MQAMTFAGLLGRREAILASALVIRVPARFVGFTEFKIIRQIGGDVVAAHRMHTIDSSPPCARRNLVPVAKTLSRDQSNGFGSPAVGGTITAMAKKQTSVGAESRSTKKPAAKRSSEKSSKSGSSGAPLVDTSLAAQSAARMLAAGVAARGASKVSEPRQESSTFKQLKASL